MFTLSITAWFFLTTDYLKVNNIQTVNVMGIRTSVGDNKENKNKDKIGKNSEKVISQNSILDSAITSNSMGSLNNLVVADEIIPQKKKDIGNTYVRAKAAVAIDVDSERILHNQNADKKMSIASLTKMMTALVVLDSIKNLNDEVIVIDNEVCRTPRSIIGCPSSTYCFSDTLKVNEKVRAKDLFQAMLVNSTNDAAVALAKHISGSQKSFAILMNKKAKEIGLKNTHFCNPTGLDEDEHLDDCYSSAEDVARISVYALKNKKYDKIWQAFKIKERWFNSVDGKMRHRFATTNILFDTMNNCVGAKTGFTYDAGKTLMMVAKNPKDKNKKVVGVVLNDPYRFDDMQKLFNWVFKNYEWK
jgi:D-alanyl-D-alanine carboxypeptidase